MSFMALDITIKSEGWSYMELAAIKDIFRPHNVEKMHLAQFDANASAAIIFVIQMSCILASGIGNAIDQNIWDKLGSKLSSTSNNNQSTIKFLLKNKQQEIHLDIDSHDNTLIKMALDSIDDVLQQTIPTDKKMSCILILIYKNGVK